MQDNLIFAINQDDVRQLVVENTKRKKQLPGQSSVVAISAHFLRALSRRAFKTPTESLVDSRTHVCYALSADHVPERDEEQRSLHEERLKAMREKE